MWCVCVCVCVRECVGVWVCVWVGGVTMQPNCPLYGAAIIPMITRQLQCNLQQSSSNDSMPPLDCWSVQHLTLD